MKRGSNIANPIDIAPGLDPMITGSLLVATVAIELLVFYLFGEYFDEKPPKIFQLLIRVAVANVTTFAMGLALHLWISL